MIKLIIKLAIAALIVHGSWRAGTVFLRYYNFKDEVRTTVQFAGVKGESDIRNRILEIANSREVPLAEDHLTVRKEETHTVVDATYTERIEIVPTYFYPYEFKLNVDVFNYAVPGT